MSIELGYEASFPVPIIKWVRSSSSKEGERDLTLHERSGKFEITAKKMIPNRQAFPSMSSVREVEEDIQRREYPLRIY